MNDIETVLERIHRRGPCLVEFARALRPHDGERYLSWSGHGVGVCIQAAGVRIERTAGPVSRDEGPLLSREDCVALAAVLRWWQDTREQWWRIGTEKWGNWLSPTVKDVVQPPGEEPRVFAIRGYQEPSPYLHGAVTEEPVEGDVRVTDGACVVAWWSWRREDVGVLVPRAEADKVVVPPDGARMGAQVRFGSALEARLLRTECAVSRGEASFVLLPGEEGVVEAVLGVWDGPNRGHG